MHIFTEFRGNKLVKYGIVFPNKNVFLYSSLSLFQPEYMIRSLIFHWLCQELSRTFEIPWLSRPQKKILTSLYFTNNPLLDPTHTTLYTLILLIKKGVSVSVYNLRDIVACSRPWESRVREIEKVWTRKYFRVPFTFASSTLSESLEQARDIGKLLQTFMFDKDSRHHLEAWKECDAVAQNRRTFSLGK